MAAPPVYENGTVQWKGVSIILSEARQMVKQLSRTPVTQGRFPTEADIIINTIFGEGRPDFSKVVSNPQNLERMEAWRQSYLKAINNTTAITGCASIQSRYDDLYFKVAEMPIEQFAKAMYERGDELQVMFLYEEASKGPMSRRLSSIWEKYVV